MQFFVRTTGLFLILSALFLISCGGGSSSGSKALEGSANVEELTGESNLTQISENDLLNLSSEGVWLTVAEMSGSYEMDSLGISAKVIINKSQYTMVEAQKIVNGTLYYDSCDVYGFEAIDDDDDDDWDDDDWDDDDLTFCEDENLSYYKSPDNSTFYMVYSCGNDFAGVYKLSRLSDTPEFDLGSASVSFNTHPSVTTDNGICGSFIYLDEQYQYSYSGTTGSEDVSEYEVIVRVPYQDNYLVLQFYFPDTPTLGEYALMPDEDDINGRQASLFVETGASAFYASVDDIVSYTAESGSVTITSISETSIEGFFNADISVDEISGSFSVLLK